MLKELREHAHITQRELADAIGVHVRTIQKWEAQDHIPDIQHYTRYLQACKFGRNPEPRCQKEEKSEHQISKENFVGQAVKAISEEKDTDKVFPYSVAKIATCLKVVLAWKSILGCTISYTESLLKGNFCYLENEETSMIIDHVGKKFGVQLNAQYCR